MFNRFITHSASFFLSLTAFIISLPGHAESLTDTAEYQQISELIREPLTLSVTLNNGQPAILDAFVTRPVSKKPLPVVLITNGTTGTAEFDRWTLNPNRYSSTAIAFARHGYAAVVVLREGYGQSSGAAEYTGHSCIQPFHLQAGEQDVQNMVAALEAVRRNSWASADNAMLVGMSAGGFAAIATGATNPPGVKAVINFDGGRGAIDGKSLCDKTVLMKTYEQYGKTAKLPSLWLYAKNDKSFPPDMGREMFNAYQQSKNPAQFIVMPSYGKDGHVFMDSAPESFWWNTVAAFLEQNHQPFQEIIKLPVVNLIEPPALNAAGKSFFRV
jgi:dienelactone hydrolase